MAETATVAFETNDLIAMLLGEVEEVVTLIARPVGWPIRIATPAPAPAGHAPTDIATSWQGPVSPS